MDKTTIKKAVHSAADKASAACNQKAKAATGWRRWLWAAGAILAAAIAWFTQSCTPAHVEQLQKAHEVYHFIASDQDCILAQPVPYIIIRPEPSEK